MKSVLSGLPYKSYLFGLCFYVIVSLILLNLKFLGIIFWSWIWIFAPIWIPLTITVIVVLITVIIECLIYFSPSRQVEFLKKFVRK